MIYITGVINVTLVFVANPPRMVGRQSREGAKAVTQYQNNKVTISFTYGSFSLSALTLACFMPYMPAFAFRDIHHTRANKFTREGGTEQ